MTILKCGAEVVIKISRLQGVITAKLTRFKDVQHEITYFQDGEHKTIWLHSEEIEKAENIINSKKGKQIGFK